MATKLAKAAMVGAQHTAGIYADMTVDGPEIGTLVVVVDRARHLPNRKTMGKQDPYCAVRLAKEAKKTETDRRGGQTPKWDQELRFPVFDSPDYHKLKVSLFNDDKKCDLIGETWIDLDDILEPGGGQRDKWFTLRYKARYAGEIQLELTFWDIRPKQEKPDTPPRSLREGSAEAMSGPRPQGKRRPLPVEPGSNGPSPHRSATEQPPPSVQQFGPRELPAAGTQSAPPVPHPQSRPPPQYHHDEPQPLALMQTPYNELYHDAPDMNLPHGGYQMLEQDRFAPPPPPPQHALPEPPRAPMPLPEPQYGGMDLPELPPHTPRSMRNSAPHTPKHYSPLDRSPAQYVLPQYGQSDGFSRMDSLPMLPAHDGYRYSDDMRALPDPRDQHPQLDRRIAHSHSYQDFSQAGDFRVPSPTATQLSSHSAPMMDDALYQDVTGRRASEAEAYDYQAPAHRFDHPPHRHSMMEPADLRYEPRTMPQGMPSYATPPRRGLPGARYGPYDEFGSSPHDEMREEAPMHRSSVPILRPQARSPERMSPIARKSVSPLESSPAAGSDAGLGGIAFSPDSFDILNPNLHAAGEMVNLPGPKYHSPQGIREAARDRRKELDLEANGPIRDAAGRIVDPTDHLPSDTWAPEPEKKPLRKAHEVKIKFRHHNPMGGTHSMPGSSPSSVFGYRDSPPPAAGAPSRPHSLQTTPLPGPQPPLAHNSTSLTFDTSPTRSRLQKKSPRGAYTLPSSSPPTASAGYHSSPGYQPRERMQHGTPLREMPNYGAGSSPLMMDAERMREVYGTPPASRPMMPYHQQQSVPPPIPAKVPLAHAYAQEDVMSPPWMGLGGLEAEIGKIDIGLGGGGGGGGMGGAGRWRGGAYRDI